METLDIIRQYARPGKQLVKQVTERAGLPPILTFIVH
jgi:hypothetical protein